MGRGRLGTAQGTDCLLFVVCLCVRVIVCVVRCVLCVVCCALCGLAWLRGCVGLGSWFLVVLRVTLTRDAEACARSPNTKPATLAAARVG